MERSEGRSTVRRAGRAYVLLAALSVALISLVFCADARGQSSEQGVDRDPQGASYVAGELLVAYETGVSAASEEAPAEVEGRVEEEIPELNAQLVTFPELRDEAPGEQREAALAQKKQELARDPAVKAVDYNYVRKGFAVPDDPFFGRQYGLTRIQAPRAWDTVLGNGVNVAVVDTGIDTDQTRITPTSGPRSKPRATSWEPSVAPRRKTTTDTAPTSPA